MLKTFGLIGIASLVLVGCSAMGSDAVDSKAVSNEIPKPPANTPHLPTPGHVLGRGQTPADIVKKDGGKVEGGAGQGAAPGTAGPGPGTGKSGN